MRDGYQRRSRRADFQWVLFGSDIDSTTVTIPEIADCFWNNGDDSPSDVDEAGVFIAFPPNISTRAATIRAL
ncbi:hypothetical protein HS125_15700 [bacterium]|nr:hypothetical protein [bacterium]